MESKESKKCVHDGHRMRLLETAFKTGLDNLSDVQVVEILLFYIFPRGDVNPLAHKLLQRFGSLGNIVDASLGELKLVDGVSDATAKKIKVFGNLFFNYAHAKMQKKDVLTIGQMVDMVEENLRFHNTEKLLLVALSSSKKVIRTHIEDIDSASTVCVNMLEFSNFLSSTHPSAVIVAHCHPYGSAVPSTEDKNSYEKIGEMTNAFGIELMDSYIVGEDGVFSQNKNLMIRRYLDADILKNQLSD